VIEPVFSSVIEPVEITDSFSPLPDPVALPELVVSPEPVALPEPVEGELVFSPVSEPVEDTDSFLGYCV
jgi:hypothetical protein